MTRRIAVVVGLALSLFVSATAAVDASAAQPAGAPPQGGRAARPAGASRSTAPTHADLEYAPPEPATSNGHKLDLYIPSGATGPVPVVIWTGGSAWMADTGKRTAPGVAAQLNPAGYAVAGVSIRSSSQVQFPGTAARHQGRHPLAARQCAEVQPRSQSHRDHGRQLRRLDDGDGGAHRRRARDGGLCRHDRRVEQGAGSGGVLSADQLSDDGCVGAQKCGQPGCHDEPTSPESRLVGCAIQTCPDKVQAANPVRYVTAADPPMMILHGGSDPLVPHNQGEQLYMALNKACLDAVFISLPKAGHGPWNGFLTDDAIREAATMRSTSRAGLCRRQPGAVHALVEDRDRVSRPEDAGGAGCGSRRVGRAADADARSGAGDLQGHRRRPR